MQPSKSLNAFGSGSADTAQSVSPYWKRPNLLVGQATWEAKSLSRTKNLPHLRFLKTTWSIIKTGVQQHNYKRTQHNWAIEELRAELGWSKWWSSFSDRVEGLRRRDVLSILDYNLVHKETSLMLDHVKETRTQATYDCTLSKIINPINILATMRDKSRGEKRTVINHMYPLWI